MNKFNSNLYLLYKIDWKKSPVHKVEDENGYLFSRGIYKTKILPSDLPEYYLYGYIYHNYGYISTKGVKDLVYKPCYHGNNLYRDDLLYISYQKKIEKKFVNGIMRCNKYDEVIYGNLIINFIDMVKIYSNYDTSDIEKEIEKKKRWSEENHEK